MLHWMWVAERIVLKFSAREPVYVPFAEDPHGGLQRRGITRHPPRSSRAVPFRAPHSTAVERRFYALCCLNCGILLYMLSRRLLRTLFILIWALAAVHVAATYFYWYWIYRWIDIPMHFLGGVWVGLAALWFWYHSGHIDSKRISMRPLVFVLLAGLGIGLLWEMYEYVLWYITEESLPSNYVADSILDIIMDVLGAFVSYGVFGYFHRQVQLDDLQS